MMYTIEVPTIQAFNELVGRMERVESENDFLRSLLTSERWLSREQAMIAIGCKDDKLRKLTLANKLTFRYEGKKPYYDVFSIRTYLTDRKIDAKEIDRRLISAHLLA